MKYLSLVLLGGMALAQTPKPAAKLPTIPDDYQSKFKTLVIKQQQAQLNEVNATEQYKQAAAQLQEANAQGTALEKEVLKKLGLDPAKYTVRYQHDEMEVIESEPSKK